VSLFITSLNSGSNGNCYYIGNGREAILVDAGISCREIEKRMQRLGLRLDKIKAVFVSHEHADHILGVPVLVKKYRLPVYITSSTYKHAGIPIAEPLVYHFEARLPVYIGELQITAFAKNHDATDPHSFIVTCQGITVGIFTDIGSPCDQVIEFFQKCHGAFLEANYDEDLLFNGRYPQYLKARISGKNGHLSNKQAFELFIKHRPSFMNHLLLSHLSKENNSPAIVESLFNSVSHKVRIVLASRDNETPVFQINGDYQSIQIRASQLSLF
jgi:phosphoribosyl 1,2-cyclic phosphodiesterase